MKTRKINEIKKDIKAVEQIIRDPELTQEQKNAYGNDLRAFYCELEAAQVDYAKKRKAMVKKEIQKMLASGMLVEE